MIIWRIKYLPFTFCLYYNLSLLFWAILISIFLFNSLDSSKKQNQCVSSFFLMFFVSHIHISHIYIYRCLCCFVMRCSISYTYTFSSSESIPIETRLYRSSDRSNKRKKNEAVNTKKLKTSLLLLCEQSILTITIYTFFFSFLSSFEQMRMKHTAVCKQLIHFLSLSSPLYTLSM